MSDFDDVDPNQVGTFRSPKPEEGFEYEIQITDLLRKKTQGRGTTHIAEYVITANPQGGSPVGFKSAYVRKEDAGGYWKTNWAGFILSCLGVNVKDKAMVASAWPYLDPAVQEAETKVPNASIPRHVIGAKLIVRVQQGNPPKPGKQYYPYEQYLSIGT